MDLTLGRKDDEGKLDPTLVVPGFIYEIASVLDHGIKKYGERDGWMKVSTKRYRAALARHALDTQTHQFDGETGLTTLAHLATNAMFLWHKQNWTPYQPIRRCHCRYCVTSFKVVVPDPIFIPHYYSECGMGQ